MGQKLGQPFPNAPPLIREAFANAAYVTVSYNGGIDPSTGEMVVDIFGSEVRGAIGEVMARDDFYINQAPKGDEVARLNLAFMIGYMSAKLEEATKDQTSPKSGGGQNG